MQVNRYPFLSVLFVGLLVLIGVVQAAGVNSISAGNTVYLGEQGLDISGAMGADTKIGWWASGADIQNSAPTKTVDVASRLNSFMVSPSEFSGYLGNWYRLDNFGKADGVAFNVVDPQLSIRVEDTTVSIDVTDKWVPSGDAIRFKLESNLAPISSQRGSPALVTIKVQQPGGGIFSALVDPSGSTVSLVDIPVTTTPLMYKDSPIWDTGNRANYPPGSYKIWVECNTNSMKDNYEQTGKTVSQQVSLLNQDQNPLIGSKKPTTTLTTASTPKSTTRVTTVTTTIPPTTLTTATTAIVTTPAEVTHTPQSTPVPSAPVTTLPVTTRTPGFASVVAGIALILGIVLYKRRV